MNSSTISGCIFNGSEINAIRMLETFCIPVWGTYVECGRKRKRHIGFPWNMHGLNGTWLCQMVTAWNLCEKNGQSEMNGSNICHWGVQRLFITNFLHLENKRKMAWCRIRYSKGQQGNMTKTNSSKIGRYKLANATVLTQNVFSVFGIHKKCW